MRYFHLSLFIFFINCDSQVKETKQNNELYSYDIEQRIAELGIELTPQKLPPGLKIRMATRSNNLIYLSGNGPIAANGDKTIGKIPTDLTTEQGYEAARLTAINHLSILKDEIGDLNKVIRIVKVFGIVNAEASYTDHPQVINGYSDLMIEVFGDRGQHARSAVGMISLPWNLACEIETIVEIRD